MSDKLLTTDELFSVVNQAMKFARFTDPDIGSRLHRIFSSMDDDLTYLNYEPSSTISQRAIALRDLMEDIEKKEADDVIVEAPSVSGKVEEKEEEEIEDTAPPTKTAPPIIDEVVEEVDDGVDVEKIIGPEKPDEEED